MMTLSRPCIGGCCCFEKFRTSSSSKTRVSSTLRKFCRISADRWTLLFVEALKCQKESSEIRAEDSWKSLNIACTRRFEIDNMEVVGEDFMELNGEVFIVGLVHMEVVLLTMEM